MNMLPLMPKRRAQAGGTPKGPKGLLVAATAKRALQWLNRVAGAYSDEEKLEIVRTFMAAV